MGRHMSQSRQQTTDPSVESFPNNFGSFFDGCRDTVCKSDLDIHVCSRYHGKLLAISHCFFNIGVTTIPAEPVQQTRKSREWVPPHQLAAHAPSSQSASIYSTERASIVAPSLCTKGNLSRKIIVESSHQVKGPCQGRKIPAPTNRLIPPVHYVRPQIP